MRMRTLVAAVAVAAAGLAASPAYATGAAYCEPFAPPQAAAIQGYGNWSPGVTAVPANQQWSMSLDANCTSPGSSGGDAGQYHFDLSGTSTESCAGGNGSGTVSGNGPEGPLAGTISWWKGGVHYYMSGSITQGGHQHTLQLWIDVIPTVGGDACFYAFAGVFGHGAIASLRLPPVNVRQSSSDCRLTAAQQDDLSGQNVEGTLNGSVADPTGAPVSLRCYVTVNGVQAPGASVSGAGTGVAVASGPVSYEATDTDDVEVCTEVDGTTQSCVGVSNTQAPPQEVLDLLGGLG